MEAVKFILLFARKLSEKRKITEVDNWLRLTQFIDWKSIEGLLSDFISSCNLVWWMLRHKGEREKF